MNKRICLIVLSHSSYKDIWELTLASYSKFFSYPIDLFITSDVEPTDDDKRILRINNFKHLLYPINLAWSCALRFIYNNYIVDKYEYIIFSFDDLVLLKNVDNVVLDDQFEFMYNNRINYLVMNESHKTIFSKMSNFKDENLAFDISEDDSYRGSLVFSCWKDSFFQKIINLKELYSLSPWEYEQIINNILKGEKRLMAVNNAIFKFANVLVKGKLYPPELKKATKQLGMKYSCKRDVLSGMQLTKFKIYVLFFYVLRFTIPPKWFHVLRRFNLIIK